MSRHPSRASIARISRTLSILRTPILACAIVLPACNSSPYAPTTTSQPPATQPALLARDVCFTTIQLLPNGKVRFVVDPQCQIAGHTFTRSLYLVHADTHSDCQQSCEALPGDFIGLQLMEMVGTGTSGLTLLEIRPHDILVRNDNWFYDIYERRRLQRISYYTTPHQ